MNAKENNMSIEIVIIILIVITSIAGFNRSDILDKYMFNAYKIIRKKQYVRLVSHGFLHANWTHLLVNVFVLYSFGSILIKYYNYYLSGMGNGLFVILFFSSLIVSSLYSLGKEKNNPYYNSLGASGAVSAVLFSAIFFDPWGKIYLYAVLPIPGIVFGIVYLIFERYSMSKNGDNIAHDAHFYGAVYGFVFPMLFNPNLFFVFLSQFKSLT